MYIDKKNGFIILILILTFTQLNAQIILLGENAPYANVNDGDFSMVWDYWRNASQSPFWKTKIIAGNKPMGLHYGSLFSSNEQGIAESKILNSNPEYQEPKVGDILKWSFGADLEYNCNGTFSLSLVFGKHERVLAEKVKLIGSDKTIEHFEGTYTIKDEDTYSGLPYVRARFYSEKDVKVYLHYVNISVLNKEKKGISLDAEVLTNGFLLKWHDTDLNEDSKYYIYRKKKKEKKYNIIGQTRNKSFLDTTIINGIKYNYLLTQNKNEQSRTSNKISFRKKDILAPVAPIGVKAEELDTEIRISWLKSEEIDVSGYSIYRGDSTGNNFKEICSNIEKNWFEDVLAPKEVKSTYIVYAHDYSGNRSIASEIVEAKVKTVLGASFSDLILPIPINKKLQSNLWGGINVVPRDPDNGIEHPDWSYWGGRPVKGKDNRYHMIVARWPESGLKGHWEWPNSTVAHTVAKKPTGPYIVEKDIAYSYKDGLGHNPDIILLNDGTYALYSLVDWEPTIFTSTSMNGPWTKEGILTIDMESVDPNDDRTYQYTRNLSGVQLDDGRILIVSKFGCMMLSENGLLGPYKIITPTINHNQTIPERYRKSNYEDPVLWRDDVQFHLIINAFLDYRAIYLRSKDGIHWKYDPGLAYSPDFTVYKNGTQTRWHKLERPHILQDKYGRATHLSVAVLDVPKVNDNGNDIHNSKNIIIPLTVQKRIKILNKNPINSSTKNIKILILAEKDFNPQKEIDLKSLRFGASEEVNFGRGSKAIEAKNSGENLIIEFDGSGNGINDDNFVGKLLGKTRNGHVLIGYTKLVQPKS